MNNRRNIECLRVAIALSALLIAGFAQGEDATGTDGVYYQVEGEGSCNSFSPNDVGSFTVSPLTAGDTVSDGTLSIRYEVKPTGLTWYSEPASAGVNPEAVNAAILVGERIKGNQKSIVYHFGATGTFFDSDEIGPSEGLAKVTFCYGIQPLFETAPKEVAVCTDADGQELDSTGIVCPTNTTDKRFIISVNPYGPNGDISVCTCNFEDQLAVCDPSIPAGTEGGCLPDPNVPGTGLRWMPFNVTGAQNGTGFCWTTLSGARQCATNY